MDEDENKTIVFIETKRRVDEITRKIKRHGLVIIFYRILYCKCINHTIIKYRYSAVCIHGDKSQYERDNVLKGILIIFLCK